MNQPIFITGAERSGSTLIAKAMQLCTVFKGTTTNMLENIKVKDQCSRHLRAFGHDTLMVPTSELKIPYRWDVSIMQILYQEGYKDGHWVFKSCYLSQMWPIWHQAFPNAHWIIVRRKPEDIVQSCIKTGYMKVFKEQEQRSLVGVSCEADGWNWWVHQYEKKFVEMIEAGVNCKTIWPERMAIGDYQQLIETMHWIGLEWNPKIIDIIDPMLNKNRRK